ncbi:MAG TPA: VOC family protein [Thermoplasmata archaeon]|nr:VOC family protein [Thermoplasmata archaeon]
MAAQGTRFLAPLLVTRDFEGTLAFYRAALGLPFTGERPYMECRTERSLLAILDREFMARGGELDLPIGGSAMPTGTTLLAFEVDDLEAAFERLSAAEVKFLTAPSDRIPLGRKYAFLRDPDGRTVALLGPRITP